jgi:hypothetical protein
MPTDVFFFPSYTWCWNFSKFCHKNCKIGQEYTRKTHFFQNIPNFLVEKNWKFATKTRHWSLLSLTLVNEGTHNNNFVCGFKPPKRKKKKKQLLIFTHGIGIRRVLVHQRSCLGSPYLHGFWNEWILLNVLTCCFKYSGSLSLSLSFWQDPKVQLMMELCCHPQRFKKKLWLLQRVACSSTQSWLSFFLSFCLRMQ